VSEGAAVVLNLLQEALLFGFSDLKRTRLCGRRDKLSEKERPDQYLGHTLSLMDRFEGVE
jgi:hypothetical protein